MTKQRHLSDLYVKGSDLTIEDVTVWIQKLNPVEHSQAVRKADAARAKALTAKFDKDSEAYLSVLNDVLDSSREVLIEILVAAEHARILPAREAKVADEEKWKTDNYLQGLRDAWNEGVAETFIDDPDDIEAKRVHDELEAFLKDVEKEVSDELDSFRSAHDSMSEKEIIDTSMEHRMKVAADMAWVNEYYRSEILLGTRYPDDHSKKYFSSRDEVDILQLETYAELASAFRDLTVEPTEGKDSAGNPPSSDSSEPSDKEATEQSSGLAA
jgi:hypothetical protein